LFVVEIVIGGPNALLLGPSSRQLYDMGGAAAFFAQVQPVFRFLPGDRDRAVLAARHQHVPCTSG
jgi:hypothetical protein